MFKLFYGLLFLCLTWNEPNCNCRFKPFLNVVQKGSTIVYLRAYPGLEFVVANTLAKRKKLEPIEIDFSTGFSQKEVSRRCFVFICLSASHDFCHLLITFANSLGPDQARQNVGPDRDPNCLTP